ncbi:MAG: 6-carboxytetrahydropterin synthase [Gemmatimonadota bacterium]
MPETSLIRTLSFSARHHYGRADRPEEWNEERFGDQRRPHRHEYTLVITVTGPPDPETSFVVDLGWLDRLLHEVVIPLEDTSLNESIPEVRSGKVQPSTEALALWFWERLAPRFDGEVRLSRLQLWENEHLGAQVEG